MIKLQTNFPGLTWVQSTVSMQHKYEQCNTAQSWQTFIDSVDPCCFAKFGSISITPPSGFVPTALIDGQHCFV
jgi:hypothetical protein